MCRVEYSPSIFSAIKSSRESLQGDQHRLSILIQLKGLDAELEQFELVAQQKRRDHLDPQRDVLAQQVVAFGRKYIIHGFGRYVDECEGRSPVIGLDVVIGHLLQ